MFVHIFLAKILLLTLGNTKEISYFSNFNNGNLIFGEESKIPDFVTLADDPKSDFPNDFTICSSLYIKFMTTKNNVIEIMKKDGTHWFQIDLEHLRDYETFSERITMFYGSEKPEKLQFWDSVLPINPHSWYHICFGVDTVSGLLRIVINGHVIVDTVKDLFVNTTEIKPTSLKDKLLG